LITLGNKQQIVVSNKGYMQPLMTVRDLIMSNDDLEPALLNFFQGRNRQGVPSGFLPMDACTIF
jgi:hypothetical protein